MLFQLMKTLFTKVVSIELYVLFTGETEHYFWSTNSYVEGYLGVCDCMS